MKISIDKRPIWLLIFIRYIRFFSLIFLFALFFYLLKYSPNGISPAGYRITLIFILAAILWATNIIPPAITSLLIIVLIPSLSILPVKKTYAFFGNEPLFFILSAFMISIATEKSGLSKRITLNLLSLGAMNEKRLILIIYLLGALLSFFMPEHAVSVLLLPIVISIAEVLNLKKLESNFGKLLFLSLAYGTIIGGITTFLGGARNALAVGLLEEIGGIKIGFFEWIRYSLPLVIFLLIIGFYILTLLFKPETIDIKTVSDKLEKELNKLPPFTFSELITATIIILTLIGWTLIGHKGIGLGGVSLISAILFFVFGIIDWKDAERGINWSAIFMYGGALTLGSVFAQTDAGEFLINKIPFIKRDPLTYVFIIGFGSLFLTEFISNATVVALLLPIALKAGISFGYDLKIITVSAALMSGLAFALPIGTPSHFVCYSANYYKIKDSFVAGLIMNSIALLGLYICIKIFW